MLVLLFAGSGSLKAQSLYMSLIQENIETTLSNPKLLIADPFVVNQLLIVADLPSTRAVLASDDADIEGLPRFDETFSAMAGFQFTIETAITPNCKYIQLPIRYSMGNFRINSSIPFFYDRSIDYSHGTVSTMGLGDMQLGFSYNIEGGGHRFEPTLNAKLPTGNSSKMVDGYLIPMGTGSFDMIAGGVHSFRRDRISITSNLSYRFSGKSTKSVIIEHTEGRETIDYSISNGNTFLANATFNYSVTSDILIRAGLSNVANSDGRLNRVHRFDWDEPGRENTIEYNDQSAHQEFIYTDANASVVLTIYGNTVLFNIAQPLYTRSNLNTPQTDRGLNFSFKLSRRIM